MASGTIKSPNNPWDGIYIGNIQTAKTLSFSAGVNFLLVTNGNNVARQGLSVVFSTRTTTARVTKIHESSAVTITEGTGQITISASAETYATIIPLAVDTAQRITIT